MPNATTFVFFTGASISLLTHCKCSTCKSAVSDFSNAEFTTADFPNSCTAPSSPLSVQIETRCRKVRQSPHCILRSPRETSTSKTAFPARYISSLPLTATKDRPPLYKNMRMAIPTFIFPFRQYNPILEYCERKYRTNSAEPNVSRTECLIGYFASAHPKLCIFSAFSSAAYELQSKRQSPPNKSRYNSGCSFPN